MKTEERLKEFVGRIKKEYYPSNELDLQLRRIGFDDCAELLIPLLAETLDIMQTIQSAANNNALNEYSKCIDGLDDVLNKYNEKIGGSGE